MVKQWKLVMIPILFLGLSMVQSEVPKGYKKMVDQSTFKTKMTAEAKKINTLSSSFEQEKYISVMSEKIKSSGTFLYKKENKLKWEYTAPFKYLIVLNDGKMYIKDKGKVSKYNVNSNKMFKGINDMLMSIVNGNLFQSKEYNVAYYESTNNYLLHLKPVSVETQKYMQEIHLEISRKSYAVSRVKLIEPGGDYTSIAFSGRKTNQPVSDDKFKIK